MDHCGAGRGMAAALSSDTDDKDPKALHIAEVVKGFCRFPKR
jgi:hypothetical protein